MCICSPLESLIQLLCYIWDQRWNVDWLYLFVKWNFKFSYSCFKNVYLTLLSNWIYTQEFFKNINSQFGCKYDWFGCRININSRNQLAVNWAHILDCLIFHLFIWQTSRLYYIRRQILLEYPRKRHPYGIMTLFSVTHLIRILSLLLKLQFFKIPPAFGKHSFLTAFSKIMPTQ